MKPEAEVAQPLRDRRKKESFVKSFGPAAAAIIVVLVIIGTAIVGTIQVLHRDEPKVVPIVAMEDLPGPKGNISKRSMYQLDTFSQENTHILATIVSRYSYTKTQSPFIYAWTNGDKKVKAVVDKILQETAVRQASSKGMSSEDVMRQRAKDPEKLAQTLRNSEEARLGLIRCVKIEDAVLNYPVLKTVATGICFATIPPFDSNAGMAITMLTDTPLTKYSELAEMRRILLALQIDIYNRDFQGRETWAHP